MHLIYWVFLSSFLNDSRDDEQQNQAALITSRSPMSAPHTTTAGAKFQSDWERLGQWARACNKMATFSSKIIFCIAYVQVSGNLLLI